MKRSMTYSKRTGLAVAATVLSLATSFPAFASAHTHTAHHASALRSSALSTLSIGLSADPPKLDPSLSSALVDRQVMVNIYDSLFTINAAGKLQNDLATGAVISKNGLTYTITLRKGVKFQDGTPFNATAVKFNLERDMLKISPRHSSLSLISKVTVDGPYKLTIQLSKPFSPLLNVLSGRAGMMVSPTAVKKEGANFLNHPVGTGPYEYVSRVIGSSITLVKNPHYWMKGLPHFQKVVYKIFTDPNVELLNLQSNEVQIIDTVPPQQIATLAKTPGYTVINKPSFGYQGVYLNVKAKPFTNLFVREAVNYAINRQALVNAVLKGSASPGYSPFGASSPAYRKAEDTPPNVNPAQIRALLKRGGEAHGFTFTMQTANSPINVQLAEVMQAMLQPYGIKMNIQQLDFGTLLNNSSDGNFQALALGWSGRLDPDQNIYSFYYTGAPLNSSNYSNPQVDALLNQARTVSNMTQRANLYERAVAIINHDSPYIFLYHPNNVLAFNSSIHGFNYVPDGLIRVATLS
ncbi:ABC transporter substrate-binding protein [Ferroacidibacillus organovorans]|uniref:Solute-binding protein family 5 domain-containing protein n=1 Tax=Ferroacidibacillus organovorans TaxID=1765683 RepID=A0A162S8L6_9BACL|nr:ABC transporter substrate-binding protein [Ferroacidibacillus organovorans]KYP79615.1 hypothetical protein AYJ22_14035 [Ferroacidibacillus organovorans]OAG92743.1 hypothetical protein AYW79_13160 [Ferroacidibacillus organovorans]OPG16365.1 hypothetical protein B2M26_05640 [Ferroacidibacillus organovorans]